MTHNSQSLLERIRSGASLTTWQQIELTIRLSLPAMLAQLSNILMEYIDAAMVGRLGTREAASIGLVATSTWLICGLCSALATGFSVLVSHQVGANEQEEARNVVREGLTTALIFSVCLAAFGTAIHQYLPIWLGGEAEICEDASRYFLMYSLGTPLLTVSWLAGGALRSSGNIKVPSLLGILLCVLDILFNFIFIFPSQEVEILGSTIHVWGADLGVMGAALGSVLAEAVTAIFMWGYLYFFSSELNLRGRTGSYKIKKARLMEALRIGTPIGLEHIAMCGAYIMMTVIVAPLGVIAIAAHSFAVTAESLCYMPGYGIGDAATTLVGQAVGAKRDDLKHHFAWITTAVAMAVMTIMGILMYALAPEMMSILSPDREVISLGADMLRIEAFAEPFYAASIVIYASFVGMGDTLRPAAINFFSMWVVRLPIAYALASTMGLSGVWIAMCGELTFRGVMFIIRLAMHTRKTRLYLEKLKRKIHS